MKNFDEMNIKDFLKKSVKEMGFKNPTKIQEEAIPYILDGKDVIGIAETGSGKTCAFGLPLLNNVNTLENNISSLVLCPTRELVMQTVNELKNFAKFDKNIKILSIYGGQQIERQIAALKKTTHVIVGTPGRIMDHLRRKTIDLSSINMLVLDEADEMLNMGFRDDLDVILKNVSKDRQTILFSATMSKEILNISKKYQKIDSVKVEMERNSLTASNVSEYLLKVKNDKKLDSLSSIIEIEDYKLAIVFCNTKRKVDEIDENLKFKGYKSEAIHGDMKQSDRDNVMRRFKEGKLNILIATDVAARGLDVDNLELVINYDLPLDEENYVHRIGRTGRAGKKGKAISFVTKKEIYRLGDIEKYTGSVISSYVIPSSDEVFKKKSFNFLNEGLDFSKDNLTKELNIIDEFLSLNNIDSKVLLAGILKANNKDIVSNLKDNILKEDDIKVKGIVGNDKKRLFLTVGSLDGANKNNLRDFVVQNTGIDRSYIHDTEILNKFSFMTLSLREADIVISKLNGVKFNERKLVIEESLVDNKKKDFVKRDNRNRRSRSNIGKRGK